MEWVKKPSFAEILDLEKNKDSKYYQLNDYSPLAYTMGLSPFSFKVKTSYQAPERTLEQRLEKYLSKWSEEAKKAWRSLISEWSNYYQEPALPWQWRQVFKKMALRLHPDHNPDIDSSERFQALYKAYIQLQESIGDACT